MWPVAARRSKPPETGLRAAGDEDVEPGSDGGLEEDRCRAGHGAELDEVAQRVGAQDEFADVDRGEPAGDAFEYDVQAMPVGLSVGSVWRVRSNLRAA